MNKKITLSMIAVLSMLGLAACNKSKPTTAAPTEATTTASPTDQKTTRTPVVLSKLEIANKSAFAGYNYVGGDNVMLEISIDAGMNLNNLIASKDIKITSSNTSVVSVLGQYVVFKGTGDVTVTVEGGGKKDEVSFYVGNPVTLVPEDTAVGVNQTMKFAVESKENGSTVDVYDWSVSDTSIATVDATGTVTGVKVGSVTVFAKSKTNSKEGAAFKLEVKESVAQPVAINTIVAAGTYTARGQIVAKGTNCFFIDDGTGTIEVYKSTTLAIGDVVKVTGPVTVYNAVLEFSGNITITKVGYKVAAVSETVALDAAKVNEIKSVGKSNFGAKHLNRMYSWKAVVTEDGGYTCFNLNGVATKLEATAFDKKAFPYTIGDYVTVEGALAGYKSDYATFVITKLEKTAPETTQVTLPVTADTMEVGTKKTIVADILKSDADKAATAVWTSSNAAAATVDAATGEITAVAAGETNITVTVGAGSATVKITVVEALSVSTLSQVTENNKLYKVRGSIVAVTKKSLVITDGTVAMKVQVSDTSLLNSSNVGKNIEVLAKGNIYKDQVCFTKVPTVDITFLTEEGAAAPAAVELTAEVATAMKKKAGTVSPVADYKLYKWTTTVAKSDKFLTFPVEGSDTMIEYSEITDAESKKFTVGKTYEIEGYFAGYNTGYNYADFVVTKSAVVTKTEVIFDKESVELKPSESADVNFTWTLGKGVNFADVELSITSANEAVATVTRAGSTITIKGVANGETNIVAQIKEKKTDGQVLAETKLPVKVTNITQKDVTITSTALNLNSNANKEEKLLPLMALTSSTSA